MSSDAQIARQWAEKARENDLLGVVPIEWYRAAARHILATTTPPTMADMTEDEREACQWMQADVKLLNGGSATCVIANPRIPGAKVRVWAPHGGSDDIEEGRVTPLPDLPRLEWPAGEPAEDTPELEDVPESTPDHPTFLSSVEDYDDAPEGTIVATWALTPAAKIAGGRWRRLDGEMRSNDDMSQGTCHVLRWGWGA